MEQKRTRKRYSKEYKYEVLSYHYSHGERRVRTCKEYGLDESLLRSWLKEYAIDKESVSLQAELRQVMQMDRPQEEDTQEGMQRKIAQL